MEFDCLYYRNDDLIEHTVINYQLPLAKGHTKWFNSVNYSDLHQSVKEILFGLFATFSVVNKVLSYKLIMQCYIYTSKM